MQTVHWLKLHIYSAMVISNLLATKTAEKCSEGDDAQSLMS